MFNRMPKLANDNQRVFVKARHTAHCKVCGEATREGKSHCTKHVLMIDYASRVVAIEEGAQKEIEAVSKRGPKAVNMNGIIVEEILSGLAEMGDVTYRRLVKDRVTYLSKVSHEIADAFLHRLVKEGLLTTSQTSRGLILPHFTRKGFDHPAVTKSLVM